MNLQSLSLLLFKVQLPLYDLPIPLFYSWLPHALPYLSSIHLFPFQIATIFVYNPHSLIAYGFPSISTYLHAPIFSSRRLQVDLKSL